MFIRSRVLAVAGALVFALFLVHSQAFAQDKKPSQKVDKAQQAEINATVKIADDVMGGQAAPSDIKFKWVTHVARWKDGKEYVPFFLQFDKDQKLPTPMTYYVRVASKATIAEYLKAKAAHKVALQRAESEAGLDPQNQELAEARDKVKAEEPKVEYAFEDYKTFNLNGQPPPTGFRIPSSIVVAPGEYQVFLLMKEPSASVRDKKAQPKAGLFQTTLTVPDFGTTPLATSTVLLTKGAETAQPGQQQLQTDPNKNPYAFFMVSPDSIPLEAKFDKKAWVSVSFFIYNTGIDEATKQPRLSVDFGFYHKENGAEKFFNRTPTQQLDGGKNFDPSVGVFAGTAIPLESFPEGEYRLEIKITDKVAGKSRVENVPFTVIAG